MNPVKDISSIVKVTQSTAQQCTESFKRWFVRNFLIEVMAKRQYYKQKEKMMNETKIMTLMNSNDVELLKVFEVANTYDVPKAEAAVKKIFNIESPAGQRAMDALIGSLNAIRTVHWSFVEILIDEKLRAGAYPMEATFKILDALTLKRNHKLAYELDTKDYVLIQLTPACGVVRECLCDKADRCDFEKFATRLLQVWDPSQVKAN
jgi:hypothetical protein